MTVPAILSIPLELRLPSPEFMQFRSPQIAPPDHLGPLENGMLGSAACVAAASVPGASVLISSSEPQRREFGNSASQPSSKVHFRLNPSKVACVIPTNANSVGAAGAAAHSESPGSPLSPFSPLGPAEFQDTTASFPVHWPAAATRRSFPFFLWAQAWIVSALAIGVARNAVMRKTRMDLMMGLLCIASTSYAHGHFRV